MRGAKRFRAGAAVVLAVVALLAGGAGAAGVRYEPPGGGFSATFPAPPEKRSRRQDYGSLVLTVSAYGLDYEGVAYFVSWVGEVPAAAMRDPLLEDIFYTRVEQDLILKAKASGRGEMSVVARTAVALGGFEGRQYVFDSHTDMGVLRVYKVGQRFYTVGVFGSKQSYDAHRAVGFLDSFRLTGKK